MGKCIVVVGGGLVGFVCVYYLCMMGYEVIIFEVMFELGGMVCYGILFYRFLRDVFDKDIVIVIEMGIEVKINIVFGRDVIFDELMEKYDVVFFGVGVWKSRRMGILGEEFEGVMYGIEFLWMVNIGEEVKFGECVIVVGGGNIVMDVVRMVLRFGVKVIVVYCCFKVEMLVNECEVEEVIEEGIEFLFFMNLVRIFGDGKVEEVELIKMCFGEFDVSGRRRLILIEGFEFCVKVDNVILVIG